MILEWVGEGASMTDCARRLGVTLPEFHEWIERYPKVRTAYAEGVAAEHAALLTNLKQHAARSPQAAMWLLECRHGYAREADSSDKRSERPTVVVNIPAAIPLANFIAGQRALDDQRALEPERPA